MRRRHSSMLDAEAADLRVFGPCIVEDWVSPDELHPHCGRERLQDPAAALQYLKITAQLRQMAAARPEQIRCHREGLPPPKFNRTPVMFRGDHREYLPLKFETYDEWRTSAEGTSHG